MTRTPTVVPRAATPEDVPAVVDLVQSAYRGDASRAGWTTEADLLEGIRTDAGMVQQMIAAPDSVVLVSDDTHRGVDESGALLACCHLERRGDAVYLGMFAVRPGRQGRGAGRAMLDAAATHADAWGAGRLELTVLNHRPELIAWYERRGFRLTGATVPFPAYDDERFGVPLRPDLVLLEMVRPLDDARR